MNDALEDSVVPVGILQENVRTFYVGFGGANRIFGSYGLDLERCVVRHICCVEDGIGLHAATPTDGIVKSLTVPVNTHSPHSQQESSSQCVSLNWSSVP